MGAVGLVLALLVVAILFAGSGADETPDPLVGGGSMFPCPMFANRPTTSSGFARVWERALVGGEVPVALDDDITVGLMDDTIAVLSDDGRVLGYHVGDGAPRWATAPQRNGSGTTSGTLMPGGSTFPPRGGGSGTGQSSLTPATGIRSSGGGFFLVEAMGSGFAVNATTGAVAWSIEGEFFFAGPTFPDAFQNTRRGVTRHSATQASVWVAPGDANSLTANDTIVAIATDEGVLGLERATGAERWRGPPTLDAVIDVEAAADLVLALTEAGAVVGLDAATGRQKWSRQVSSTGESGFVLQFAAIGSDQVLVHDMCGDEFVAIDVPSGREMWRTPLAGWGITRGRVGEQTMVVSDELGVAALDRRTGEPLAELTTGDQYGPGVTDGDRVCLVTGGQIPGLDPDSTGEGSLPRAPATGSPTTRPPSTGTPGTPTSSAMLTCLRPA